MHLYTQSKVRFNYFIYIFFIFRYKNYIINWITMTSLIGCAFTMASYLATLESNVEQQLRGRVLALHSVVTGSIRWDPIRSEQLSSGSVYHTLCFPISVNLCCLDFDHEVSIRTTLLSCILLGEICCCLYQRICAVLTQTMGCTIEFTVLYKC